MLWDINTSLFCEIKIEVYNPEPVSKQLLNSVFKQEQHWHTDISLPNNLYCTTIQDYMPKYRLFSWGKNL